VLVGMSQGVHDRPVIGVAAGAIAGMTVNFFASRWLVFTGNRAR
jgi:hypothetical protein